MVISLANISQFPKYTNHLLFIVSHYSVNNENDIMDEMEHINGKCLKICGIAVS